MIPDKNFRMTKPFKRMLALMTGSTENRNGWKRMFIEAQLHEEAAKRAALKSKESDKTRGAVAPE